MSKQWRRGSDNGGRARLHRSHPSPGDTAHIEGEENTRLHLVRSGEKTTIAWALIAEELQEFASDLGEMGVEYDDQRAMDMQEDLIALACAAEFIAEHPDRHYLTTIPGDDTSGGAWCVIN